MSARCVIALCLVWGVLALYLSAGEVPARREGAALQRLRPWPAAGQLRVKPYGRERASRHSASIDRRKRNVRTLDVRVAPVALAPAKSAGASLSASPLRITSCPVSLPTVDAVLPLARINTRSEYAFLRAEGWGVQAAGLFLATHQARLRAVGALSADVKTSPRAEALFVGCPPLSCSVSAVRFNPALPTASKVSPVFFTEPPTRAEEALKRSIGRNCISLASSLLGVSVHRWPNHEGGAMPSAAQRALAAQLLIEAVCLFPPLDPKGVITEKAVMLFQGAEDKEGIIMALEGAAGNPEAPASLTMLLYRLKRAAGQEEEALPLFERMLAAPDRFFSQRELRESTLEDGCRLAMSAAKLEVAEKAMEVLRSHGSEGGADLLVRLAAEYVRAGRAEDARAIVEKVFARSAHALGEGGAMAEFISAFPGETLKEDVELYAEWLKGCKSAGLRRELEFQAAACLYNKEAYEAAIARLDEYEKAHGKPEPRTYLLRGLCRLKAGEYTEARESLAGLLKDFPDSESADKAMFLLGWSHLMSGENEKAAEWFDKLLKEHPASPYAERAEAFLSTLRPKAEENAVPEAGEGENQP